MKPAISIFSKIKFILLLAFTLSLVITLALQITKDRELVHNIINSSASATANNFFDSLNVMMLTGTIDQKSVLIEKFLDYPEITHIEVIRSENFVDLDGVAPKTTPQLDDFDRRALQGESLKEVIEDGDKQRLLLTNPIYASSMDGGTNCLECHKVQEGTLMGAVRIEYDLTKVYQMISQDIFKTFLLNFLILTCTLLVTSTLLYRIMLKPLKQITQGMESAIDQRDLNFRIDYEFDNELGRFGQAYNQLIETYRRDQLSLKALKELQKADTVSANTPQRNISGEALKLGQISNEVINRLYEMMSASHQELSTDYRSHAHIDLLRSITDQASLISLNTSIEVMRQGDTSDIAEEIRICAMQTSEKAMDMVSRLNELESQLAPASREEELTELLRSPANRTFHTLEVLSNHLNQCSTMFSEISENARIPRPAYVQQEQQDKLDTLLTNTRKLLRIIINLKQNLSLEQNRTVPRK